MALPPPAPGPAASAAAVAAAPRTQVSEVVSHYKYDAGVEVTVIRNGTFYQVSRQQGKGSAREGGLV